MGIGLYKPPSPEAEIAIETDPYDGNDSVTISKKGLEELKTLLSAAKSSDSCVRGIERRAGAIVTSKAVSRYTASA
jgi:hypothetical protein